PMLYVPQAQRTQNAMAVVVRAAGDAAALAGAIRSNVAALDKDQPIYGVKTMDQHLCEDLADTYILGALLIALAGISLGLAAAGIFGVVAYAVGQRTHEIGIRIALGADRGAVQRMIISQGLLPVGIGAAVGLAIGYGLVETTAAAMREMRPRDP